MRKTTLFLLSLFAFIAFAGCSRVQTGNPVSDGALVAFNEIVAQNKDRKGFHAMMMHWGLSLPGGDKLEWTKDTAANEADFVMVIAAEPFLNAGLDTAALTGGGYVFQEATIEEGKPVADLLLYTYNVSDKKETAQGSEDAMRRVLKQNPALVSHHAQSQRYRLTLADGFEVQWTEKPGLHDVDIAFRIAADPLIAAGVDGSKLHESGWTYQEAGSDADLGSHPNQFVRSYTLAAAE